MYRIFFVFVFLLTSARGQEEGQPCLDRDTKTKGRCKAMDACKEAKDLFEFSGIIPTYCSNITSSEWIVCCRLPRPPIVFDFDDPTKRKRVSDRHCLLYNASAHLLPPDLVSSSVSKTNCKYIGFEMVAGGETAKAGEFPHMAAIGWNTEIDGVYKFSCGGSLINARYIVTAAHCSYDRYAYKPEPVIVRLGDHNVDNNVNAGIDRVDVLIQRFIKHPKYQAPKVYDDIALIELVTKIKFRSAIRPACLWTKPDLDQYQNVIATGWGKLSHHSPETAKDLQKVSLPLLNSTYCNVTLQSLISRNWLYGIIDSQICAGELKGGKDTCQGDSGGPIQVVAEENPCLYYIIGLTSFGKNCADMGRPAVYTRVSSYIDWIESVAWHGWV